MKCRRIQELMGAYIYGDLSPDEMREVRLHSRECRGCREDLESRGGVLSQIPSTPPSLSNEDRLRIAWSVKGAVRSKQLTRQPLLVRFAPVFAAAIVLTVGAAVGALYVYQTAHHSSTSRMAEREKGGSHPAAVAKVKVKEDRSLSGAKDNTKTAPGSGEKESGKPDTATIAEAATRAVTEAFRNVGPAVTTVSRGHGKKRKVIEPEAPVSVVPTEEERQPKDESGSVKLPEPTDVNDARTTPPKQNE